MKSGRPDRDSVLAAGLTLVNARATADLAEALDASGVPAIVLKGETFRQWLYAERELRPSDDIDLLVPWGVLEDVEAAVVNLGWTYLGVDAIGEDRVNVRVWEHPTTGAWLEIHRSLPGLGAPHGDIWSALSAHTERAAAAGRPVTGLDEAGRLMHAALHAAQHGAASEKTQEDLRRALQRGSAKGWRDAAALAESLDGAGAFVAGLRLLPQGEAKVRELGLDHKRPTEMDAVRAAGAPLAAEGVAWVAGLTSWRARLRYLVQQAFPPSEYLRVWSPVARRGPLGLVASRLGRPFWLLWRLGPAVRAWRRAR